MRTGKAAAILLGVGACVVLTLLMLDRRVPAEHAAPEGAEARQATQPEAPVLEAQAEAADVQARHRARDLVAAWQAARSHGDWAQARAGLELLRVALREGRLTTRQMLEVALVGGLRGDAEAFRERIVERLRNSPGRLATLMRALIVMAVDAKPHHRAVVGRLLVRALDSMGSADWMAGGLSDSPSGDLPVPLSPADFDLVARVIRSQQASLAARIALLECAPELGARAPELIPDALALLRATAEPRRAGSGDDVPWSSLLHAIAAFGEPVVAPLIKLLGDADEELAEGALRALKNIDEPAAPALLRASRHAQAAVRRRAIEALVCGNVETPEVLEALRVGVRDEDGEAREWAARGLPAYGQAALPDMLAILHGEDATARASLLSWLEIWAEEMPEGLVAPVLARLPAARDAEREDLLAIVSELGPRAAAATPDVLRALAAEDSAYMDDRGEAEIVASLGPAAGPHVLAALEGDDPGLRTLAAYALGWLDELDVKTVRRAAAWIDANPERIERFVVAAALVGRGIPGLHALLAAGLEVPDWRIRAVVADALADLGASATGYLRRLADLCVEYERDVDRALTTQEDPRGALWSHASVELEWALRYIGPHDLETMFDLLDHESRDVRDEARYVLQDAHATGAEVVARRWRHATGRQRPLCLRVLGGLSVLDNASLAILEEGLASAVQLERAYAAASLLGTTKHAGLLQRAAQALADILVSTNKAGRGVASKALTGAPRHGDRDIALAALRLHEDHENDRGRTRVRALIARLEDER